MIKILMKDNKILKDKTGKLLSATGSPSVDSGTLVEQIEELEKKLKYTEANIIGVIEGES